MKTEVNPCPKRILRFYLSPMNGMQCADCVEVDVRRSCDGVAIIMHDAYADRTTNGKGPVFSYSLAELNSLDAGEGERGPTLREALERVAGKCRHILWTTLPVFCEGLQQKWRAYSWKKNTSECNCDRSFGLLALDQMEQTFNCHRRNFVHTTR